MNPGLYGVLARLQKARVTDLAREVPSARPAAGRVHVSEAQASRILSGHRDPTPAQAAALDRSLALGEPKPNETDPTFVVAIESAGAFTMLIGEERAYLYPTRRGAEAMTTTLAEFGITDLIVVPAWAQWVGEQVAIRRGRKLDIIVIGSAAEPEVDASHVAAHLRDVLSDLAALREAQS